MLHQQYRQLLEMGFKENTLLGDGWKLYLGSSLTFKVPKKDA